MIQEYKDIAKGAAGRLRAWGKPRGYSKPSIDSWKSLLTEIIITNKHAIRISIDWRDQNVNFYVAYLYVRKWPDHKDLKDYDKYINGHWFLKRFEDVYKVNYPVVKLKKSKWPTRADIPSQLEFYFQLMENDPDTLERFIDSLDEDYV